MDRRGWFERCVAFVAGLLTHQPVPDQSQPERYSGVPPPTRVFNLRGWVVEEYIFDNHGEPGLTKILWVRDSYYAVIVDGFWNPLVTGDVCVKWEYNPDEIRQKMEDQFVRYWTNPIPTSRSMTANELGR